MPCYTQITAEFELITPAFIGGARKDKVGEVGGIDPKAIKAALRHWWRVLNWQKYRINNENDSVALARLHQAEMRLFGAIGGNGQGGGQGLVQVLLRAPAKPPEKHWQNADLSAGIIYLLGQGLYSSKLAKPPKPKTAGLLRAASAPHKFSLTLVLRHPGLPAVPPEDEQQILTTLKAFGLLGGLGTRQTRGFGSVRMTTLQDQPFAQDVASYEANLRALLPAQQIEQCLLPAFCKQARMQMLVPNHNDEISVLTRNTENKQPRPTKAAPTTAKNAWALLDKIGEEFLVERSYGYRQGNRRIALGGFTAQCFYEDDHDWIASAKAAAELAPHKGQTGSPTYNRALNALLAQPIPRRTIFGLPYGFDQGKEISVRLTKDDSGRRASPLHIHITQIGDKPVAVMYTLPSTFLPEDNDAALLIKLNDNEQAVPPLPLSKVNTDFKYAVLDDFLHRFTSAKKLL